METLLNCFWLLLGLSLITGWSAHALRTCACKPTGMLPSRKLQLTALLLLVVLLFPVISLTDDLAMSAAPRDAERALRLHDHCDGSQSPAMLPSSMAWMDAVLSLVVVGPRRTVEEDTQLLALKEGARLPVESRPPPLAL